MYFRSHPVFSFYAFWQKCFKAMVLFYGQFWVSSVERRKKLYELYDIDSFVY